MDVMMGLLASPKMIVSVSFLLYQLLGLFHKRNLCMPPKNWLNYAKLRISYGALGNQDVSYYEYIASMGSSEQQLLINGIKPMGVTPSGLVSNSLTWEKVYTKNIGLDLNFFNNRLTFSGDIYRRDTKDMLTKGKTLPSVLGALEPRINAADMKTEGWEISLGWRDLFNLGN